MRSVPKEGFTTNDIGMFKGIREGDTSNSQNHWARPFVYAKSFTDDYRSENATMVKFGMLQPVDFPHQIDQPVLNGETFFRMVAHYYELGVRLGLLAFADDKLKGELRPFRGELRSTIVEPIDRQSQPGGDRYAYVRGLLDALLLYFCDRFGTQERDRFAGFAARHVMVPRARNFAVRRETINSYALGRPERGATSASGQLNLFYEIRDARSAREVLNREVRLSDLYGSDPIKHSKVDTEVVAALWSSKRDSDG